MNVTLAYVPPKKKTEHFVRDQQTNSENKKTNSQKRLFGIFDFPPIYVNCLSPEENICTENLPKTQVYNFIYQFTY